MLHIWLGFNQKLTDHELRLRYSYFIDITSTRACAV